MKKILILAVIGLLAGVGGGTGIAVVMRENVPNDSVTVKADTAHHDSTIVVAAAEPDTVAHAPADSAKPAVAPAALNVPEAPPVVADAKPVSGGASARGPRVETPTVPAESDSTQRVQVRRISRIFAAMAPREAAKVLQQLEDADVLVIVGSLNEKQAAAILQALPPERAAAISKGSLRLSPSPRGQRP